MLLLSSGAAACLLFGDAFSDFGVAVAVIPVVDVVHRYNSIKTESL